MSPNPAIFQGQWLDAALRSVGEMTSDRNKAIEEFRKNAYEAGASEIRIHYHLPVKDGVSFGDQYISIFSNANVPLNTKKFKEIRDKLYNSVKGRGHHGVGILSFLVVGKSFVVVSKDGDNWYVENCVPNHITRNLESHYGGMLFNEETASEQAKIYVKLAKKYIGKYECGSYWMICDVGQSNHSTMGTCTFDYSFKPNEIFNEKQTLKMLRERLFERSYKQYVKYNHSDWELVEPDKRSGKNLKFTEPQGTATPLYFETDVSVEVKPGITKKIKRRFEITAECDLWFIKGDLWLLVDGQNRVDLRKEMTGTKVSGAGLYLDTKLRYHLSGRIDIKIKPLDADYNVHQYPQLQHSSGRSGIDWLSSGGRAVDTILGRIASYVKPKLNDFILARDGNKTEKVGRDMSGKMDSWLKHPSVRDLCSKMSIDQLGTGNVIKGSDNEHEIRCKYCGRRLGQGFILDTSKPIHVYRCRCGASYEKQKRSLPVAGIGGTKPRQKLHGRFGLTIVTTPLPDKSIISMFENGVIFVNTNHSTFISLKEKEEREIYIQNLVVIEIAKLDKSLQSIEAFGARLKQLFSLIAEVPIVGMKSVKEDSGIEEVEAVVTTVIATVKQKEEEKKQKEEEKMQLKNNRLQELKRALESKSHI